MSSWQGMWVLRVSQQPTIGLMLVVVVVTGVILSLADATRERVGVEILFQFGRFTRFPVVRRPVSVRVDIGNALLEGFPGDGFVLVFVHQLH